MPVAPADAVAVALDALGPLGERDVDLGAMTTYRVGGRADVFVRLRSLDDLGAVAAAHRRSGLPVLFVGRGSNLLVADGGFRGIAVHAADATSTVGIDHDACEVVAGGGVLLPVLARRTAHEGLTGFEWAVGVPGSVGGAVKMNAGGHGSDMAASLVDVDLIDLDDPAGTITTVPADRLGLRFRGSSIPSTTFVVSARLRLALGDRARSEAELADIVAWRRTHQPGGQNAGSVFVNPVPGEVSAGALIDGVGLRGHRLRTAYVSDKHANFIQADADGSADDVRSLMDVVRRRVLDETGYRLRSEIRLIGFDHDELADEQRTVDAHDGGATWV